MRKNGAMSFVFHHLKEILESILWTLTSRFNGYRLIESRSPSQDSDPEARRPATPAQRRSLGPEMLPPPESTLCTVTDSLDDNGSEYGDSELKIALDRLAETKRDLELMSEDRRRYRNELNHANDERKSLEKALHEAQLALRQRDAQLRQMQAEYARLQYENKELSQLAEDRLKDVRSLESFMTKTDSWSGAQVVQMVKDLNMVLLQYSAAVSEECTSAIQEGVDGIHRSKAIERISARLGVKMGEFLKKCHQHDPTLLQIGLQAALCQNAHSILSSFSIGIPSRYDSFLSNIFHSMHVRGKSHPGYSC